MPKAWEVHKAELVRLYITEGRPLKDVQETLRRHHGFKASTRAYRMKIDEWGLRKYKSSKDGPAPLKRQKPSKSTVSSTASISEEASPVPGIDATADVQLIFDDINIPAGPVSCSDLLPLIQGPYAYRRALEILLIKWQPGGQYMQAALDFLEDKRYSLIITRNPPDPDIFTLASTNVPTEERSILMKALMEANISIDGTCVLSSLPSWVRRWRRAATDCDWESAKTSLEHSDLVNLRPGKTFADCALIDIAERLLKKYQSQLKDLDERPFPLTPSEVFNGKHSCKEYMDILSCIEDYRLSLDASFYRYSITIMEWYEFLVEGADESRIEEMEHLNTKHEKYRQLISIYSNKATNSIDDCLDLLLEEAKAAETLKKLSPSIQNSFSLREYNDHRKPPNTAATNDGSEKHALEPLVQGGPSAALEYLYSEWKASDLRLKEHVQNQIIHPDWIAALFGSSDGHNSIFDLILLRITRVEQMPLTKALLLECSAGVPAPSPSSYILFCWRSVFMRSKWSDFKGALEKLHLDRTMSQDAASLVLDSTFLLVGERLLKECKARLYFGNLAEARESTSQSYTSSQSQYLARCSDRELHQTILTDLETGRVRTTEDFDWPRINE